MLSRRVTTKIAFVLDQLVPPIIRDARWFMWAPFRLLFGRQSEAFFTFKDKAFDMSFEAFKETYEATESAHIQRETDLNEACTQRILSRLEGQSVLEVGCGRVYLARQMAARARVTACDIAMSPALKDKHPDIELHEASIEKLPFADNAFDTVVSTHTLEHVLDIVQAIAELRRVAKKRVIIVVPKQRPYKYTFDLHLHFFPYEWSLLAFMAGAGHAREIELLDGDWYYQEDVGQPLR